MEQTMSRLLSALSRYVRLAQRGRCRRSPARASAGRRRRRPTIEILEDRSVPTAVAAPSGIVSWWTGNGNAADSVGPNSGTLNSGVTFAPGEVSSAFSFNDTDYVSANTTGLPTGNSDRTMEMWVKVNAFSTNESFFAGYGAFGTGNQTYHLGTLGTGGGGPQLFFSQWGQAILGPALQAGQWYHIAVTNVADAVTLYLNGSAVATGSLSIATPQNSPFYIGRIPGSLGDSRQLNGLVDEVSVYNRALTSSEIQGIYKAGSSGKVQSPIAVTGSSVVNGSGPVTFTITRTSTSGSLTVNWTTADDTATAGTDYVAASGTVTFADGQATQTVPVTTLNDTTPEQNEDFELIATPSGGTSVMGVATLLTDNTNISVSGASAVEGSSQFVSLGALVDQAGSGDLNGASAMAFGPDGNLYVASAYTSEVLRYNATTGAYMGAFVTSGSGGLSTVPVQGMVFGPDGKLYVASRDTSTVLRYDATTGTFLDTFIPANSGGLLNPKGMIFGPDGNLYVSSSGTNQVLRYDATTGAFIGAFIAAGSGGLSNPRGLTFGPDGNLYVASSITNSVLRFDGTTGAFLNAFIPAGSGGLSAPAEVLFANGSVYVSSQNSNQVLRYDATTGGFLDVAAAANSDGLQSPLALLLDANNNLLVGSNSSILRYGPASQAAFTVSLAWPSAGTTTVSYATADGTALAGTHYTATSGTLTFAPGETSKGILVPTLDDSASDLTRAFTVNLSNPTGGAITSGQGIGTILDDTKFYVVNDGGNDQTYQYSSGGAALGNNALGSGDTAPRGVATTAAGTTEWVVDANKNVYVYSTGGVLLGSWSAGGLSSSATLTGIATNGTDIWLVDSYSHKVYDYTGAASLLSGSQSAASSFKLSSSNSNPQDLVTDGTSFWVVDGSKLKVFKYTLSGSLLGSWSIDPADTHPTGITINPNNVSDIWIVDNGTDKVYDYTAAAGRTSGSQSAASTFALAPGDTNPQGIADPPPADLLLTPTAVPLAPNQPTGAAFNALSPGVPSLSGRDAAFARLVREPLPRPGEPAAASLAGGALTPWLDSSPSVTDRAGTAGGVWDEATALGPSTPLVPETSPGFRSDRSAVALPDGAGAGEESPASAAATDAVFAGLTGDALPEE
jgi:outer membrane protein assembly factor BamB